MTTVQPQRTAGTITARPDWTTWVALAVIAGSFAVRFPAIVQPMGPDQGVYATIGWCLQRGLELYRDLWEQKPPGIYLTYLLGFTIVGNRTSAIFLIDYAAAALTVVAVFAMARRLVDSRFAALAAAFVAVGTLPAARHGYGGFLERSVTETFITPLAAAAAWAAVTAFQRQRHVWAFAAGLFIGIAAVYKQTALIYLPALVAWTVLVGDVRRGLRFAAFALAGTLVAPALAVTWLWSSGVLGDAWIALVEYNLAYLAIGDRGFLFSFDRFAHEVWRRMKTDEVWALGTLGAAAAAFTWRPRAAQPAPLPLLLVVWLGAALTATLANGPRFFTTYFMPSLVPLSLLAAWLVWDVAARPRRARVALSVGVALLLATMLVRSRSPSRATEATLWDARHLLGRLDREEYLRRFSSRATRAFSAADNARLADYLRARTEPDDRVFVFGMTAGTYFSSGRLPASRFLWAYPSVSNMVDRPDFRVETLAAELSRTAPAYIVLQRSNGDSFSGWRAAEAFKAPPLADLVDRHYRQETEIGDFVLYRRGDAQP